ncbi:MAG: helix-turn-helix domain-containing protein [Clostridia bacterium]|nr:helix-turn-helix domain-containing protein [Clostridia bacterium]
MIFPERLLLLRRSRGMTQEALAERLHVSRQAVAKWEAGQAYPDIANLIALSNLMNVTVDYLVRDQECAASPVPAQDEDLEALIAFRLEAGANTYAAQLNEAEPSRPASHDYRYARGPYLYIDTYVGGERFAGEEAIWRDGRAVYAMNYAGRVLGGPFSGHFLKEALRHADRSMPYRGPEIYRDGEYLYRAKASGSFEWFQGYEEILWREERVYECFFHGGLLR